MKQTNTNHCRMKTQNDKRRTKIVKCLVSISAGLLMCLAGAAKADDLAVNSFDSGVGGIDWQNFRSYAYNHTETWDPNQDSEGNTNSGSLYLTVNWPLRSDATWNQNW